LQAAAGVSILRSLITKAEVTIPPGAHLGSYQVLAPIGAGGMGEVYRARDTRLDREVALKLLPPAFASDPDRLARFEREARLLASLNHPNVAQVYGFERAPLADAASAHLLAMELVEGEDLAERLVRGPLPVEEAVAVARQIAEGLEAAHEKGIVHRDLKPANLKLTREGQLKILDFGLAKAWTGDGDASGASQPALSQSPTLAHTGTAAGLILGTAAYMSPEQARGKAVDKRADIWAFGVVLFEMLSGRRLFAGETVSDVLAAVLKTEPDWSALPEAVPPAVRGLLARCLEREPKLRLRDIGEARVALAQPTSGASAPPASAGAARATSPWRLPAVWAALAAVAVAAAAAGVWGFARVRPAATRPVTRLSIQLPPGQVLSGAGGPAISRDGRLIAYAARDASGSGRLYLRALDRFEASLVPESEGAQQPFFSPDGTRVGFFARGKLLTAGVAGGAPTPIAEVSAQPMGGAWGEDDRIVFVPSLSGGLLRVASSGGSVERLSEPDEGPRGYAHGRPQLLPGGRSLLFTIWGAATGENRGATVLTLATGTWTHAAPGIWSARYARSGHLVLSGPAGVRAAPFDPDRPQPTNPQTFVLDEVFSTQAWSDSWFALSDEGTLVYVPGDALLGTLAWVERDGRVTPVSDKTVSLVGPNLSPEGERITFQDRDDKLWVMDLRRGTRTPLTADGDGSNAYQVWSRDGRRVIFASNRGGDWDIYSVPAGGGTAERILARKGNQFPLSLAPDGTLLFDERSKGRTGADILTLAPDGSVTPFLVSQPATKAGGQFSPDGHAVAYVSDESGRDEVYVRPFGRPGEPVAVSTDGGNAPRWSPDGREIFYRSGDAFLAASVSSTGDTLAVADARKLFQVRAAIGRSTFQPSYCLSPDGRRFLVLLSDERAIPNRINVVLNWFDELRAKVPAR
jgi:Tol biopolymer transport system component